MRKHGRSLNRGLGSRVRNGSHFSYDHPLTSGRCQFRPLPSLPSPPSTRMDPKRERYNSRARQSVAGGASHKKRRRRGANRPTGSDDAGAPIEVIADPNAEIVGLKPFEQKELERRERIKRQVCSPRCVRGWPPRLISSLRSSTRWRSTPIRATQGRKRREWKSTLCVGYKTFGPS